MYLPFSASNYHYLALWFSLRVYRRRLQSLSKTFLSLLFQRKKESIVDDENYKRGKKETMASVRF